MGGMLEPKQFVYKGQRCSKELSVKGDMMLSATYAPRRQSSEQKQM